MFLLITSIRYSIVVGSKKIIKNQHWYPENLDKLIDQAIAHIFNR